MKKYITVPEDITFIDLVTRKPIPNMPTLSFRHFIITLLSDSSWMKDGYKGLLIAHKIHMMIDTATVGDVLMLDLDVWERLKGCAENPADGSYRGISALGALQLLPFIETIKGAEEKPRTTKEQSPSAEQTNQLPCA